MVLVISLISVSLTSAQTITTGDAYAFTCVENLVNTNTDYIAWYNSHCITPPIDVCNNIEGNQAEVPQDYYADDGACYPKTPVCADDSYDNYGGENGQFDPETEVANNELCVNEPVEEVTPTPTQTPNVGGPGDGRSDGLGCGSHDCSQGQVLGASTGPAVLGLSTTSSGGNGLLGFVQLFGALALSFSGFSFFKKNA